MDAVELWKHSGARGQDKVMAMKHPNVFLTAEWKNLVMLNYAVDASLLDRFVPAGTELDSVEGITYLSLVGFEFNRSRILGFPVPFHQTFEEVNLRFYVRRLSKRGVVFIRELVPKFAVAAIARLAFNETIPVFRCRIELSPVPKMVLWRLNMDGVRGRTDVRCGSKLKGPVTFRSMVPRVNLSQSTIGAMRRNRVAAAWNMRSSTVDGVSRVRNGLNSLGAWPDSMGARSLKL